MKRLIDASDLYARLLALLDGMRKNHSEYDIEYVVGYMEALQTAMLLVKNVNTEGQS